MTSDDKVVDQSVFGAAQLDCVLLAPARLESFERGDASAGRGPLLAPFVDDFQCRTVIDARHVDGTGGAVEQEQRAFEFFVRRGAIGQRARCVLAEAIQL